MSRLNINIGTTANDRTGDPLRTAFEKVNANFVELYSSIGSGAELPIQTGNEGKFLRTDGTTLSWVAVTGGASVGNFAFAAGDASLPLGQTMTLSTYQSGGNKESKLTLAPTGDSALDVGGGLRVRTFYGTGFEKSWTFNTDGSVTFPDASVQTTAYTGSDTANLGDLEITGATIGTVDDSIAIKISVIDSSSTVSQWQFGTTGILSLPAGGIVWNNSESPPTPIGGWLASSSLSFDKDVGAKISNGVGGVGSVEWTFGKNGNLTLPVGGDVVDSTGTSVLGTPTVLDGGNASTTF
jgi:hypothetical protein